MSFLEMFAVYTAEASIVIRRPLEEVFDVATCQERCQVWQTTLQEARKISDGPTSVGSEYIHRVKFLGVTMETHPVITEYEPPHRLSYGFDSPLVNYQVTFIVEPVDDGTKVTARIQSDNSKLKLPFPESFGMGMMSRQYESDLQNLKAMMEAEIPIQV
jgi:uncharacterized protein YndB with AHSA1/START domain